MSLSNVFRKFLCKIRSSLYVFKKAEIMQNVVNKEIAGEYDNLCHQCYFNGKQPISEEKDKKKVRISIYLGGALGDYIVYLRFVDEISLMGNCEIDLFLDRIVFAEYVFGSRPNVNICHDVDNCLFINNAGHYDFALHLDHGITVKHCNLGQLRIKSKLYYDTVCRIFEYTKARTLCIDDQDNRQSVLLRRAKFAGDTKWSLLSCGGAIDMGNCYSSILIHADDLAVLERYQLTSKKYVTVNYGADKNMGGTAQTKVLPLSTLESLVQIIKIKYPDYIIVQTGTVGSDKIAGADVYAFECSLKETAVVLKNSLVHIDSEGGLVHLASQMSTPCVVSFGPTPSYYYGYARNENIVAPACNDCMSAARQWNVICPKKLQTPECMQSITAEMIMQRIQYVINKAMQFKATQVKIYYLEMPILDFMREFKNGDTVALIGELTKDTLKIGDKIKQAKGDAIFIVDSILSDQEIAVERKMINAGMRINYGTVFSVAVPSACFSVAIYTYYNEVNLEFAQEEMKRIVKDDGEIYFLHITNDNMPRMTL